MVTALDTSPITNGIGQWVQQSLAQRLGGQAMAGDQAALAQLAARDPRAAMAIGSILQSQQEQQMAMQQRQAAAAKQRQELTLSVARGYRAANDKQTFLNVAAQQLQDAGHPELAQAVAQKAAAYATDPAALDREADSIISLYGPQPEAITPYQQETLKIDREKAANESKKLDAELGIKRENLALEREKLGEMRRTKASELEIQRQKLLIDQQEADLKKANSTGSKGATEDERKAAGWLAQAQNAYVNMERALAQDKDAGSPGVIESLPGVATGLKNISMSDARQKYTQAANSFAEAALRAATGAGVNRDEAEQKIRELTPKWGDGDEVKAQKRASLKVYLSSLKDRSGRAAPAGPAVPEVDTTAGGIKFLGFE